ncbi:MAG: hypothetical protein ACRDHO_09935 [Actinomycetota bacterium]
MLRLIPAVTFFAAVAGVLAVDLASWTRTAAIRRGTIRPERDGPGSQAVAVAGSSRTTMLAAAAGMAGTAWGAVGAGSGAIEALAMVAAGTSIAIAGSVARVTGIRVRDDALIILFAARPAFRARWTDICGLRPPCTPVGGWQLSVTGGTRATLMPSDLFGHEEVLALIVRRGRLRFDGRRWVERSAVSRQGW